MDFHYPRYIITTIFNSIAFAKVRFVRPLLLSLARFTKRKIIDAKLIPLLGNRTLLNYTPIAQYKPPYFTESRAR